MEPYVRHNGEIRIDPPIPAGDLKHTGFHPDDERVYGETGYDVRVRLADLPVDGAPGTYRKAAVAVEAAMDLFSGHNVMSDLQHLFTAWGHGRTFSGRIRCAALRSDDQWSYCVRDGAVTRDEGTTGSRAVGRG